MMIDHEFWRGRRVFVTGHTGFKGGWLSSWLLSLGSDVTGWALAPDTEPCFFDLVRLAGRLRSLIGDVRDPSGLRQALQRASPEIVFHLAAQPLVRRSYRQPVDTFETNVMGTVHMLEAARSVASVRAVVVVTSDKCYASGPTRSAHREEDPLGGADPYSASKACAEIVAAAWASSFFGPGGASLATARAGNVIGGGDWSEDRIVPDAIRALSDGNPLLVRNPDHVRPWQHVLEPLSGYLMLAERLHRDGAAWTGGWNFGPREGEAVTVSRLADLLVRHWGSGSWESRRRETDPQESPALLLDHSKARGLLEWRPRLDLRDAVEMTVLWYRAARELPPERLFETTMDQIRSYEAT